MSTGHVLMGLLARGPRYGYELKRAHDSRLPSAKPLPFGQVYATLGRLERDGHVEQSDVEREGGPDRVRYRLTDGGRAALRDWIESVEPPAAYLGGALFVKVVVALLATDRKTATRCLTAQRAAHLARMRELTKVRQGAATVGEAAAADYTITHLDADLRWMERTIERVEELDAEIDKELRG